MASFARHIVWSSVDAALRIVSAASASMIWVCWALQISARSNRIEIGTRHDSVLPRYLGDARIAQKPIAWRQWLVVALGHTRAVTCLLSELEGRLERIHEQSHRRIEPRQLLGRRDAFMAAATDHAPIGEGHVRRGSHLRSRLCVREACWC